MRIPLRCQFMLPLLGVAIVSLAAISAVHAQLSTLRTRERIEHQLQGVAAVLAGSGFPLTNAVLNQMGDLANADFLLTDDGGDVLASSLPADTSPRQFQVTGVAARRAEEVALGPLIEYAGAKYYSSSLRIDDRRGSHSSQVLHMLFPQDVYNTAWRAMFVPPLLVGLAAVAGMVLTTQLVAVRINGVLRRLGSDVRRLAAGDFSAVDIPKVDDETKDLAIAVNDTARQLAKYEGEVRRTEQMRTLALLGSGLAHEMRNAATGCRMAVDLHTELCTSTAEDDDSLQMAKRQLQMMEQRLQKFLRLGKPSSSENEQLIDFGEMVRDLLALLGPAASHAGVVVEANLPAVAVEVRADSEQLSQALMNVMLNALEAASRRATVTGESGTIRVHLSIQDGTCVLLVADTGDGPPATIADNLFEPFVSDKPEGVGLGLAVAREVMQGYGGSLHWRRESGETVFVLRLPQNTAGVTSV